MVPNESVPTEEEQEEEKEKPVSLTLSAPLKGNSPPESVWTLLAHNRRVLKDWEQIVRDTSQNAINAYDRLRMDAMVWLPKRCFGLKHKDYAGIW